MAESRWVRIVPGDVGGPAKEAKLFVVDDYEALPAAASHTNRLARNTTDGRLYFSNGVSWRPVDGTNLAQIYDQPTAPTVVAGYVLLWFKSSVSADPNDREMFLVK